MQHEIRFSDTFYYDCLSTYNIEQPSSTNNKKFKMKIYVITVHLKFAKNMAKFLIPFVALFAYTNAFCMNMPGGIGEYHHECTTTSIGMCPYNYTYSPHYHGWSDTTVIERRQQQLGRMADFLPPVTFSVFDL